MLKFAIFMVIFGCVGLLGSQFVPFLTEKFHALQARKARSGGKKLEGMFFWVPANKLLLYYTLSPVILSSVFFFLFHNSFIAWLVGLVIGVILPEVIIKVMGVRRIKKLQKQLVDGLMVLSSSFKGGLSLLQAMEVLVEEMPPPLSQEFSLVVRENKVGVSLEESLSRLNKRVNLEELELMISAILVARETGGDLTKVFTRLANTLREKQKVREHIATLTLQGRIQGIIMSVLPIFFVFWVISFNRHHFDIMLQSSTGRLLIILGSFLQIVGMLLIYKFSKIKF
jgi:tight adherence protein B